MLTGSMKADRKELKAVITLLQNKTWAEVDEDGVHVISNCWNGPLPVVYKLTCLLHRDGSVLEL